MTEIVVTLFQSEFDPHGSETVTTWPTLIESLREQASEEHGPGWSPATFGAFGQCKAKPCPGHHRKLAAMKTACAIILDLDAPGVTLESIKAHVTSYAIVHTTRHGRFRVIVPTSKPIKIAAYRRVWNHFNALFGGTVDGGAKSPAQFFYLPGTGCPGCDKCSGEHAGKPASVYVIGSDDFLDASTIKDVTIEVAKPELSLAAVSEKTIAIIASDPFLSARVTGTDGARKQDDITRIDRSATDWSLVQDLHALGVPAGEIAQLIVDRGELSHRTDAAYLELTVGEVASVPVIRIGPDVKRVTDEAVEALRADKALYWRGERLAYVTGVQDETAELAARGTPRIRVMRETTLRERLSELAKWLRFDKQSGEWSHAAPPFDIVKTVSDRGEWPIPILEGISESPIVRPDGSVFATRGYDSETGFLCLPRIDIGLNGKQPDRDDARRALVSLREVWRDFPFANASARDVPIAMLIALACRAAAGANVPIFCFDGPVKGSGKTLLLDTIALIAQGRRSFKISFPGDDSELEKRLSAYARMGAQLIAFDNAGTKIKGDALDRAVTSGGKVSLRVLGESRIEEHSWTAVVCVTGNQINVGGDTTRRAIVSRIVPKTEGPANRPASTFTHWPLDTWVETNRARLLRAAIDLLRAFLLAGSPTQGLPMRGSFEDFIRTVASAIVWAGGESVVECWKEDDKRDDDGEAHDSLIKWLMLRWPDGATSREIVRDLFADGLFAANSEAAEYFDAAREVWPTVAEDVKDAVKSIAGGNDMVRSLAYAMRSWREVYRFGVCINDKERNGKRVWYVTE